MDIMSLWKIYAAEIPDFIRIASNSPAIQRLKYVGMNCGCEYTSFPLFSGLGSYSRFDHSIGVGLIVWHFTRDRKQALAALLHDISTPTFAHVVDFLRGDYLLQEATEDGTREQIQSSPELQEVLSSCGLCTNDVCDYHRFPVADNATPRLSADRLEYTMGNMLNFGLCDLASLREMYDNIRIGQNESTEDELSFGSTQIAERFTEGALKCSRIYVSDSDRYSMQILSEILRDALNDGVIRPEDLIKTEPELIDKLKRNPAYSWRWNEFCAMKELKIAPTPSPEGLWRKIPAKKRYIDPLIAGCGRISELNPDMGKEIKAFLSQRQDYWISVKKEALQEDK